MMFLEIGTGQQITIGLQTKPISVRMAGGRINSNNCRIYIDIKMSWCRHEKDTAQLSLSRAYLM